jgi:uncharacterized RDD family membrane protein YckC
MESEPVLSTAHTIIPRQLAAIADNLIAMILGVCAAKFISHDSPGLQTVCFITIYFGYFFVFEALISRTPGKLLTGLKVVRTNGNRISAWHAAIRTTFRIVEVNPALLGALPAALSIVFSRHNQRFGDKAAGTIVVRTSEL